MELIDGKKIAAEIKQEIAAKVAELKSKGRKVPHLAAILVGHDGGSENLRCLCNKGLQRGRIQLFALPL